MTCGICHNPNTPTTCPDCQVQTRQDLTWLMHNLPDLEHYRLNRVHGRHSGGGGGTRSEAPAPLRETIFDLLYGDRQLNVKDTLNTWAICLGEPPAPVGMLAAIAHTIRDAANLWASSASPVYATDLHTLTKRLQAIIANMDETRIRLGTCLNPDCRQPVYGPTDADMARCDQCGNTWTASLLRRATDRQLRDCDTEGTPGELATILDAFGVDISPNTIRSWAYRGKLEQTADKDGQPTHRYRLSDVYTLHADKQKGKQ